jgi:hypothetical protein
MSVASATFTVSSFHLYGPATLGEDGVPNKLFLTFFFSNAEVGTQFVKDVWILQSTMVCSSCGSQMSWSVDTSKKDGFRWRYQRIISAVLVPPLSGMVRGLRGVT